jgi:hypothetical protein
VRLILFPRRQDAAPDRLRSAGANFGKGSGFFRVWQVPFISMPQNLT